MADWITRLTLIKRETAPPGGRGDCAVSAILTMDGSVLLIKRGYRSGDPWSRHWALPGGFWKEQDVSLLNTALREVLEEVGIGAEHLRLLGWLTPRSPRNRPELTVHPLVFLAMEKPPVRLADELEDYRWAPLYGLERGRYVAETPHGPAEVDAYVWGDVVVWGLTYTILRELRGE
ncbi:putative Nudix hydrolase NudL [Candidatus Calditenuaceae archaeon HR02]|nr:putative Nudix hydrolase NudL [Candidatus Calditenuaceae archaeon HR02]